MAEIIIIDGIDISKCEHYFEQFDNWYNKNVVMCDCTLGYRCEPKKNCCKFYAKYLEQQLEHKKQELNQLQNELYFCKESLEDYKTYYYKLADEYVKLKEKETIGDVLIRGNNNERIGATTQT